MPEEHADTRVQAQALLTLGCMATAAMFVFFSLIGHLLASEAINCRTQEETLSARSQQPGRMGTVGAGSRQQLG